jgi:cyanate lyase
MNRNEITERILAAKHERGLTVDFKMDVQKRKFPDGDRVVITLDGTFLPYQKW